MHTTKGAVPLCRVGAPPFITHITQPVTWWAGLGPDKEITLGTDSCRAHPGHASWCFTDAMLQVFCHHLIIVYLPTLGCELHTGRDLFCLAHLCVLSTWHREDALLIFAAIMVIRRRQPRRPLLSSTLRGLTFIKTSVMGLCLENISHSRRQEQEMKCLQRRS